MKAPLRSEIWYADLAPARGHEQGGRRPALVVSAGTFNTGPAGLVVILPLTTRDRSIPLQVAIDPPEGGMRRRSFVKCEDVRSVDARRLSRRVGAVGAATMAEVEDRLRMLLGL